MQLHGSNQKQRGETIRARRWFVYALVVVSALSCSSWNISERSKGTYAIHGPRCGVVVYQVPLCRPMVSLDFVATIIDTTREQAREKIETGEILFAWDLSREQGCRTLIRVWTRSAVDFLQKKPAPKILPSATDVLNDIFPNNPKVVTADDLSRKWNTDHEHPLNLVRAGLLRLAQGEKIRCGRGNSPKIDFASVAEFMEERQLC